MKASLRTISRLTGLFLWPFIREVTGTENFPATGPCVLAANHLSVLDGVVLAVLMNNSVRHTHFISYKYLFEDPFVGFILRINQGVVLDSSSPEGGERALADCRRLLGEGKAVGLFPEAHTSPFEKMHKARPGAALLALETGAPVCPVGLVGTQKVAPRRGELPGTRWNAVSVRFGEPLDFSDYREAFAKAKKRESLDIALGVSTIIMRAIARLSGQEYRHGAKTLERLKRRSLDGAGNN